jgi:putative PIN family toxin of toxin-antitoxin system
MFPLRLVVDTNVLISAAIRPTGLQRTVLLLAFTKPARLYVSRPILEEYGDVLARPELRIRKGLRQQLLQLIKNQSYTVAPARRLEIASDPDDNMFLECADAARADYLVTGNQKHFPRFWKKTRS